MRPKFDPKEEFLIAYYRRGSASGASRSWIQDFAFLLVGIGFFALGLSGGSDAVWSIVGFCLLAYRVALVALAVRKYDGVFTSIIDKYESALDAADAPGDEPNTTSTQDRSETPAVQDAISNPQGTRNPVE